MDSDNLPSNKPSNNGFLGWARNEAQAEWAMGGKVDDFAAGDYDPSLYAPVDSVDHLDVLPAGLDVALGAYEREGFLAVHEVLSAKEVEEACHGVDRLISGEVDGFRGVQWESKVRDQLAGAGLQQRRDWVRKLIYFVDWDARLAAVAQHPEVLRFVEAALGGSPVLFADQGLLKPPGIGREKPWHQDKAFFDIKPGAKVVGVWIALDAARPENGCMHVIPRTHQGGATVHFRRRDFQICDTDVEKAGVLSAELPPGGVLFFDGLLHHGTPANDSTSRRWALQFHYAKEDDIWRSSEERAAYKAERLSVFGAEGKDVTC